MADLFAPPAKTFDATVANLAGKVQARVPAKAKGEQYVPTPEAPDPRVLWIRRVSSSSAGVGFFGLVVAAFSFIRKEEVGVFGAAAVFCVAAIAFWYVMGAIAVVVCLALIGTVMTAIPVAPC